MYTHLPSLGQVSAHNLYHGIMITIRYISWRLIKDRNQYIHSVIKNSTNLLFTTICMPREHSYFKIVIILVLLNILHA